MASPTPSRVYLTISKPFRRRHLPLSSTPPNHTHARYLTSSSPSSILSSPPEVSHTDVYPPSTRPRWAETPPLTRAPVRIRRPGIPFRVNEDPSLLDKVYERFLGPGGATILSEEVKWLAVTHKSFDHGRRGYNDRLAFLGRRIINLQASLSIISRPPPSIVNDPSLDANNPFAHPSLTNLPGLQPNTVDDLLRPGHLAILARRYGFFEVVRWEPKQKRDLDASGVGLVMTEALFAIVGAVALERGGGEGKKVARERILAVLTDRKGP